MLLRKRSSVFHGITCYFSRKGNGGELQLSLKTGFHRDLMAEPKDIYIDEYSQAGLRWRGRTLEKQLNDLDAI